MPHITEVWAIAAAAVVGAGVSLYGISEQKKANQAALAQNQTSTNSQNSAQWSNYLMTRGIAPTTQLSPGQLPTSGQYKVVNARLPIWATIPKSLQGSQSNPLAG